MAAAIPPSYEHSRPAWSVPGALGYGLEPFDGAAILDEMSGEQAVIVWQILRDVDLWLTTNAPSRLLFAPTSLRRKSMIEASFSVNGQARDALLDLAALLRSKHRELQKVSAACALLAEWASGQGLPRTAFASALRAALASPRDPARARLAGVMARRVPDYLRSEAWLKRSLALARRTLDGREYGLALMSMGNLHMVRYEMDEAVRKLRQALKAARRFALWDVRALAYHDLFLITSTHESPDAAARYALAAVRAYGRFHPRLPALAHDLAWFMLLQDRPAQALSIFRTLDTGALQPQEQLLLLSNVARAAGGAGDRQLFGRTWEDFWRRLDQVCSYDRVAEALINLAWGAAGVADVVRLEVAAREAARVAEPRQEQQEIETAQHMLACLAQGGIPAPPVRVRASETEITRAVAAAELLICRLQHAPALRQTA